MNSGDYPPVQGSEVSSAPSGEKRNLSADNSGIHRAKRNRYTSVACNECKRRKIKCNGREKCERCSKLGLECVYTSNSSFRDSEEFQQMKAHVTNLQSQVESLYANLNGYQQSRAPTTEPFTERSDVPHFHDSRDQPSTQPRRKYPTFHGPTSSAYSFDVAKSSLQSMGIAPGSGPNDVNLSRENSPVPPPARIPSSSHPSKDPLWVISREDAIRLVRHFDEEISMMYPIFELDQLITRIDLLWTFIEAALRTGLGQPSLPGADALDDEDTNVLKMVLASSLLLENNGQSDMAVRLFESVRPTFEMKFWNPPDMKTLTLFILTATFFFHKADEVLAWRFIGVAARMSQQMGLHRCDTLMKAFPNEAEYRSAVDLFWAIYVLDRRFSMGTGLPFVLHDEDIDPYLPEPEDSNAHLKAMVRYGHVASKFWYFPSAYEGISNEKRKDMNRLDYRILQWYKDIPDRLNFDPSHIVFSPSVTRGIHRIRLVLYLRLNLARLQVYRPVLYSALNIYENRAEVKTAIEVAKDTIRVLTRVNQVSDLYRTHQIVYNFFLVQALAALLLAVCHAPADYGKDLREEFYLAIDLVKGFSANSFVSERLWRTVRGLREIGEKLGLGRRNPAVEAEDAHSNAAMAMADLAGQPIENIAAYNNVQNASTPDAAPLTGAQISDDLTNLFEFAYGNWADASNAENVQGFTSGSNGDVTGTGMIPGMPAAYGNEQEFSRIIGEIF